MKKSIIDYKNIPLGFSTGSLAKLMTAKEALAVIHQLGCGVVELGFLRFERIKSDWLDEISSKDLTDFYYVSLHAPKINYGYNEQTRFVFKKILGFNKKRKLDTVVFHPDLVEDFNIFNNVEFNISFENMDNRKELYRTPDELKKLLDKNDKFKLVLDVNHAYVNDESMKNTKAFYELLGDRIQEVHLTGYDKKHEPLYQTKQLNIIKSIQDFKVPMIEEAPLTIEEMKLEWEYLIKVINNIITQRGKSLDI